MKAIIKDLNKIRISNLIKYIAMALVLFMYTNSSNAQNHSQQGPPPIPDKSSVEKIVNNLAIELELSKDQKEKVSNLYTEHFDTMRDMTEESKVTGKKPHRKTMEILKSDFESNVKAVLTKDQQKKFKQYMNKMKNHRQNQPVHRSGSRPDNN